MLEEVSAGADYLSKIVSGVRPLAYAADQSLTEVDVHAGLEQALVLVRHKVPPGVRVVRDLDPQPQVVEGWAADLAMVWTNLLDNALAAVGQEGEVTVRTRGEPDAVVVDVENTGPTVPPEVLARVFDAFYTTKPIGQGTGLGLATSLAVVAQRHKGTLTLTSADGVTRARVVLPRHRDGGPATEPRPSLRRAVHGPGRRCAVWSPRWTATSGGCRHPCAEAGGGVGRVVNHVVGATGSPPSPRAPGRRSRRSASSAGAGTRTSLGDDPGCAYRTSAAGFCGPAVARHAARHLTVPAGTLPAPAVVHFATVEILVHGVDLAGATGQPIPFADGLAAGELGFSRDTLGRLPEGVNRSGRPGHRPPRPCHRPARGVARPVSVVARRSALRSTAGGRRPDH